MALAPGPSQNPSRKLLEIGKAEVVRHGGQGAAPRVALFGLGGMCTMAEEAADLLEAQGISAAVINPRWIKPMDTVNTLGRSLPVRLK